MQQQQQKKLNFQYLNLTFGLITISYYESYLKVILQKFCFQITKARNI